MHELMQSDFELCHVVLSPFTLGKVATETMCQPESHYWVLGFRKRGRWTHHSNAAQSGRSDMSGRLSRVDRDPSGLTRGFGRGA